MSIDRKRSHSCSEHGDDSDIPSADVCKTRCEEFAHVTGTDEALAQFYLQDVEWDVQKALNAYFEANSDSADAVKRATGSTVNEISRSVTDQPLSVQAGQSATVATNSADGTKLELSDRYIKLISWNIDGLDTNNILTRTRAIGDIINTEKPDIVFLQEVIPQTYQYLENKCDEYDVIAGDKDGYFTAFMFKKRRVKVKDYSVTPFYSSRMHRNLLIANIVISGIKLHVITSHLESTSGKEHTEERVKQLKAAFNHITDCSDEDIVIFGGDLNLRDRDVVSAGGLPDGMSDLWEACGSRPELRYTWDTSRNTNCPGGGGKARCRFDRLYLRQPVGTRNPPVKPAHFGLRGLEKLPQCQRFPSDHWALIAVFQIITP